MRRSGSANAPKHLSPRARRWWLDVVAAHELTPTELLLLTSAGEALDRAAEARERIAADGLTVTDRFDCEHEHPALLTERLNRSAFASLVKQLDLPPATADAGEAAVFGGLDELSKRRSAKGTK